MGKRVTNLCSWTDENPDYELEPITYRVGDHVYLEPGDVSSESFYIGIIMAMWEEEEEEVEEKEGEGEGKDGLKAEGNRQTPLCRIGWFHRPNDVLRKTTNNDPRLLVASMNSDVNPVTSLQGKLTIKHTSNFATPAAGIPLEEFKKRPDCFYFNQLYDKYIQRLFDVIPVAHVLQLLPQNIQQALSPYEFILVEAGKGADFMKSKRVCLKCNHWCDVQGSIECVACRNVFHRACVNVTAKITKGYAWECAACMKVAEGIEDDEEEEEDECDDENKLIAIEAVDLRIQQNSQHSKQPAPPIDHKHLSVTPPLALEKPVWPYRYFGDHTHFDDLFADIDSEYKDHPKCSSRIGKLYQVEVPDVGGLETPAIDHDHVSATTLSKRLKSISSKKTPTDAAAFKTSGKRKQVGSATSSSSSSASRADSTLAPQPAHTVFLLPSTPVSSSSPLSSSLHSTTTTTTFEVDDFLLDQFFEKVESTLFPKSSQIVFRSIDVKDHAMSILHSCGYRFDEAYAVLERECGGSKGWTLLGACDWTLEQVQLFEEGILEFGHDLEAIKLEFLPDKSMRELVVFFYQWKKSTRYQPVYSTYCLKNRPGKIVKTLHHLSSQTPMLGLDSLPPPCLTSSSFQHHQSTFSSSEPTPIVLLDQVCSNCQITLKQVVSSATKKLLAKKIPKQRPDVFYPRPFIFSSNLNSKSAALCYDCHVHWFKYGAMQHIPQSVKRQREEEAALVAAAAISPEKVTVAGRKYSGRGGRSRGGKGRGKKSSSKATTRKYRYDDSEEEDSNESDEDEDTPPPPPPPCSVCRSAEFFESNPMVCCLECGLYVHQSCYGLSSSTTKASQASFVCDRCFNDNSPVANINYHCILCPAEHSATRGAMKKTIGNNWVHVQCAIWVPEVQFGNAERFESVECTGLIKSLRFDEACSICLKKEKGACVKCSCKTCRLFVHVMCAQNHGEWELSIEENHRSLSQTASIHCPDHRKIRQYTTTIDLSSKIKEFVLRQKGNHEFRAFATTVGQKRFLSWDLEGECACHMLSSLKRGKKLQQQELSTTNNFEPVLSDPCCHCGFTFSPVWWTLSPATGSPNIPPSPPKKECHRCHWQKVAK